MENIKDFILKRKMKLKNDHLPPKFICKVCENVIEKAKATKCGHRFCGKCIMEHLALNNNCPDCGILLNADSDVSNDFSLDIKIENLIMTCPNPFCDIKLCVAELSLHVNECTNNGAGCTLQENADLKRDNSNLRREIDKEAGMNDKKADLSHKIETIDSEIKEIRHESRARTEGARANPETVQHELGLSGAFSASAQHKFSLNNLADKVERFYDDDLMCNEFNLHNYMFIIWIRRSGDDLSFCVYLSKGIYDEVVSWPLKRRMRWKVLDADDSDKVLAVQNFSYETEDDCYKDNYNKPGRNDLCYPLDSSEIKQKRSELMTKYKLSILVEME